jgi:hypothetical protein
VKPEGFEIGHLSKVEFMQPRQGWLILCFLFGCIKKPILAQGETKKEEKSEHIKQQT